MTNHHGHTNPLKLFAFLCHCFIVKRKGTGQFVISILCVLKIYYSYQCFLQNVV